MALTRPLTRSLVGSPVQSVTGRRRSTALDMREVMLWINGESNPGGLGANANATAGEVAARSAVQILNVAAADASRTFQNLDVGTNNLQAHAGLEDYYANSHGIELGLANAVEAGRFNTSQIHIVKTGQGGSKIADWADPGTYWNEFALRVARVKTLKGGSFANYRHIIWFNQGINDILVPTNEATWKAAVKAHLQNMRDEIGQGDIEIIIPNFGVPGLAAGDDVYNDSIAAIASEMSGVTVVSTAGTTVTGNSAGDTNHWNYQDLLLISERTVDIIVGQLGTLTAPSFSPAAGTYEDTQMVTLSGPAGAQVRYTTDGSTPSSHSTLYTTPIEVSADTTIKAIAIGPGYKNSSVASAAYNIDVPSNFVTWDVSSFVDAALDLTDPTYVDCTSNAGLGTSGAGARANGSIDATAAFRAEWNLPSQAATQAIVVYIDDVQADDFKWVGDKVFITGAYNYDGTLYFADGGYATAGPHAQAFPVRMKMEKSGNNVLFYKSTDGGENWTLVYTDTGALTGKTTIYLKILFAEETTNRTIAVELYT